ncbi:PLD nuclease N-terminal domain-containing protein [Krasilnikovia sp. MM14-A1259]|uniref:PLD nuclease N-terminal domain-containing protein n=1 Tax=Krasilnikovia sp. MM14-A1259 TaxID=3373539 RepID=UPI003809F696
MFRLYSLFVLLDLALLVAALIDCLSADEFAIRALPRVVWVFLILLFSPIGAIVWFVAGRPARPVRLSNGQVWRPGSGFPESERPRRPVAPDDDPDFLRGLTRSRGEDADRRSRGADNDPRSPGEDRLGRWEDDLRRREEELRRRSEEQ